MCSLQNVVSIEYHVLACCFMCTQEAALSLALPRSLSLSHPPSNPSVFFSIFCFLEVAGVSVEGSRERNTFYTERTHSTQRVFC